MNKSRFHILPSEQYIVKVGNHNEEISGKDILAILEAAFDEASEYSVPIDDVLDRLEEILDSIDSESV
jgi:hypothetical protein